MRRGIVDVSGLSCAMPAELTVRCLQSYVPLQVLLTLTPEMAM